MDDTVRASPETIVISSGHCRSISKRSDFFISVLAPAPAHFQKVEPSRFIFHERLVSQRPACGDGREISILIIPAEVRGTVPTKG